MTIPGVCSWAAGIEVPGGMLGGLADGARLADLRLADFLLTVRTGFRFGVALAFGLGLLIPGIAWPSCCANTLWPTENDSENNTISVVDKNKCVGDRDAFLMIPDLFKWCGRVAERRSNARTPNSWLPFCLFLLVCHLHLARVATTAAAPILFGRHRCMRPGMVFLRVIILRVLLHIVIHRARITRTATATLIR